MEHFFSPNSGEDLRSDAHRSQIFGEDADEDHTQIIGGGYSQIIGGIYPPSPGFGTPDEYSSKTTTFSLYVTQLAVDLLASTKSTVLPIFY